ncbi:MAG TPA: hypothetical protein VKH42_18515, partial [Vicinamibacterales bacterium]|nr:hypothetical protein [Vicinamibacterales bacterium]
MMDSTSLLAARLDALDLTFGRRQACAMLHPEPVHLPSELVAEFCEQLLVQELLPERFQHSRFDFIAPDSQVVVAPSLIACPEASEAVLAGHDESGAADAALRQSREQILRPPGADRIASGSDRVSAELLALLCRCPRLVGHNAQL